MQAASIEAVLFIKNAENAIILLNYIGRPEPGTNMYSIGDAFGDNTGEGVYAKKNISRDSGLSYFDKVNKAKNNQ